VAARPGALRVAFDAAPAHHDPTGVGVYVRDLAMALLARDPDGIALIGVRPDGPLAPAADATPGSTFLRAGGHHRWLMTRARSDAAGRSTSAGQATNRSTAGRRLSSSRWQSGHEAIWVSAAAISLGASA